MKIFLNFLIALIIAATVIVGVSFWKHSSEAAERNVTLVPMRKAYTSSSTPGQYITYLKQTVPAEDPDLWRRIEAVKRMKTW